MSDLLKAAGFIAFPFIGSIPGGIITKKAMGWYDTIKKPSWRPPKWAFGPVWTTLYASMGYASYLVWKSGDGFHGESGNALMFYAGSLAFNWAFTPLFFGFHKLGLALANNIALWGFVATTGYKFHKLVPLAGYLFIPYLVWVSLATGLSYCIWRDNPASKPKEE